MDTIEEIKKKARDLLPKEAEVSKIEMWGPELALYTKNPEAFLSDDKLVSKTAAELKKKINIRPDKPLMVEQKDAKARILELVPPEAEIKEILFNPSFGEVVIEAMKPGLVIGKGGQTSKQIILDVGWNPEILRAPTQPSKILTGVRHHLHKHEKNRKEFLKKTATHIYRERPENGKDWVRVECLGSFREVGRSCILVRTPETKVIMDCGVNVASHREPYPYLDVLDFPLSELDAVVISHAHMDHQGFLPYLFKAGYRGPVYCTTPTRDLMTLLQFDYIDVLTKEGKEPPYSERDVKEGLLHVITREYGAVTDIAPDMRITFHNAAHILGSASVHLHVGEGGHNLVYSADIKYGFTRLFDNIDLRYPRLETLILESTYGGRRDIQPNRQRAEERLYQVIKQTVEGGGNVLIPVFGVGRGQEIMLVIENYYRRGMLEATCYVDGMTQEASAIHTAYPEYMREGVRRRILQNDSPFSSQVFQLADYSMREEIVNGSGNIIVASSGMLTGGPSLEYLKMMAPDARHALIFVGFQSEGSLGRKLQNGAKQILTTAEKGRTKSIPVNMLLENVDGFSGHSDKNQLVEYVKNLKNKPKMIIVNHGEEKKAVNFAQFLSHRFKTNAVAPRNLDALRLS